MIALASNSHFKLDFCDLTINGFRVQALLQHTTESGSHKDHAGRFIIQDEYCKGSLGGNPKARLLVPSSGNFGHSIATHTSDLNTEVIIVSDVLSPKKLLDQFKLRYNHVQVEIINEPDAHGSHMQGRLKRIAAMMAEDPRLKLIDQYSDQRISLGYELHLLNPLYAQLHGEIAAVFVAVGTGGLANSLVNFRRRFGLQFKIFAVDADGSCLARPPRHPTRRRLPGYGNGMTTRLMNEVREQLDRWITVQDEEAVQMCHDLLTHQNLFVGPSSGAVLAAVEKLSRWRPEMIPNGNVVAILPDGGNAYEETVFNPQWLRSVGLPAHVA